MVTSLPDTLAAKNAKSEPMQAARQFPIAFIPGDHLRQIEKGNVEGVYVRPGGIELRVSFWQPTTLSLFALASLVAGLALAAVIYAFPDFARG